MTFFNICNVLSYILLGDNMEKDMEVYNHSVTLTERKSLILTGVKKIENFDNNEFLLETNMGYLTVKGSDLEIVKLDTYQGNVSLKGEINSLVYNESQKNKEDSIISKLFK